MPRLSLCLHRQTGPWIALAFCALAASDPALAQTLWMPVDNWSQSEVILDIRVSSDADTSFGPNDLSMGPLWPGEAAELPVSLSEGCLHDIRVETQAWVRMAYDVDLCAGAALVVGEGEVWLEYPAEGTTGL